MMRRYCRGYGLAESPVQHSYPTQRLVQILQHTRYDALLHIHIAPCLMPERSNHVEYDQLAGIMK